MIPFNPACGTRMTGDERKMSIISCCIPLFAKKGFEGTTTKDIAEASQVSEALLYRHFKSKDDIYEAIRENICKSKDGVIKHFETLPLTTESLVFILYFILLVINHNHRDPVRAAIPRLFLMSSLEDGKFVREFNEIKFGPVLPIIEKLYEHGKKKGEISNAASLNPKQVMWFAYHVSTGLKTGSLPGKIYDYGVDQQTLIQDALRFVLRGIGVKEEIIHSLNLPEIQRSMEEIFPE